ncbi:acyltransferase family protein [Sphingomonas sp.]|uniref:acyltransferase family protein n=1 Tax=Sphingomonas sp. TaxID=28214 RepID=UPI003B00F7A7
MDRGDPRGATRPFAAVRSTALPSLDGGRFVAAALVMLFHYSFMVAKFTGGQPLAMTLRGGHAGVEYFFVLSGFIIFHVHRRDVGRPGRVHAFAEKRAIRVLPMLWLILAAWGTLRALAPGATTNGDTGFGTLALDMLLIPHSGPMVLGVTWTLIREAIFYALFATLIVDRRLGVAVLAGWQVAVAARAALGTALPPFGDALLDVHNLGFGIGMLIAAAPPLRPLGLTRAAAIVGAALFAGLLALEWRIGGPLDPDLLPLGPWRGPLLYTGAAALLLLGLASMDRLRPRLETAMVRDLAGASYLLYLTHGPTGSLAIRLLQRLPALPPTALLVLLSIVAVAAALLLHLVVERPLLAWLRAATRPASVPAHV